MFHNNPRMHGVQGLGLVDLRSLRWTHALIDIKIYVFADSHLLSRHSNLNRSCTNDCHQRKFVLCQWYCFWLEPSRHTLHSTPLHQGGNAECDKQGSNAKSSFAVLCILHTAQTPQPWPRYISTPTSHPADHQHVLLPVPALHCHQDTCHWGECVSWVHSACLRSEASKPWPGLPRLYHPWPNKVGTLRSCSQWDQCPAQPVHSQLWLSKPDKCHLQGGGQGD